jgi:hypothetical protein
MKMSCTPVASVMGAPMASKPLVVGIGSSAMTGPLALSIWK